MADPVTLSALLRGGQAGAPVAPGQDPQQAAMTLAALARAGFLNGQEPYTPADYMKLADAPPRFDPFMGPPGEGAPNVLRQPGEGMFPRGLEPRALGRMGVQTAGAVGGAAAGAPLGPPGMIAGGALGGAGAGQAYDAALDAILGTNERAPILSGQTAADAAFGAMGPAAGPVSRVVGAGARAVGRATAPAARAVARHPIAAGGAIAGGTTLATQGETQQPLPDPTAADRKALTEAIKQRASLDQQRSTAIQERDAQLKGKGGRSAGRGPIYEARDLEVQRLTTEMTALDDTIKDLRQRTSPEYKAKLEKEAYEEQQRRELAERNMPFQDRHPALANALPYLSGATALTMSALLRRGNIGRYNKDVDDIANRWQTALDDAAAATTPEARQQAMMTAQGLQEAAEKLLKRGPSHRGEYGPALAAGEMAQLYPSAVDYASSSPGSPLREHVMQSINPLENPGGLAGRVLQGLAWGYGGAKIGQGLANMTRGVAQMPNLGPQTEALRVPIGPRGPSGPTLLAPAEPAGPSLPPPQAAGALPSPGPAPQGPTPQAASPSLPPPAPPASSGGLPGGFPSQPGGVGATPQPNVTFGDSSTYRMGPFRFEHEHSAARQPAKPPQRQTSNAPAPLPEFPSLDFRARTPGPIEGRHWVRPGSPPRAGEVETWVSPEGRRALERVAPDKNQWRIPKGKKGAGQFADPPSSTWRRISAAEPSPMAQFLRGTA